jgi:UDP-glucuronate 4-epimerase
MKFINVLEEKIGMEANKQYTEVQPGDVLRTYADVSELERDIDFKPSTSIEEGLGKFVDWYKDYYNITN